MEDELGLRPTEQIPAEVRARAVDALRAGLRAGQLSLAQFESALDAALGATREAELVQLVRRHAPPVAITPPSRQLDEPLVIATTGMFQDIRMRKEWQVPRQLKVRTGPSKIVLDFTSAVFDDWTVEIEAQTALGDITVIVPRGMAVQLVSVNGPSVNRLDPPIPGYPVLRLKVNIMGLGKLRLRHARESRKAKRERRALSG